MSSFTHTSLTGPSRRMCFYTVHTQVKWQIKTLKRIHMQASLTETSHVIERIH